MSNLKNSIIELIEKYEDEIHRKAYAEGFEAGRKYDAVETAKVKSPNQQRAELIEKAERFVQVKSRAVRDSSELAEGYSFKEKENPNFHSLALKVEFVVNTEKRTIVALLKTYSGKSIKSKGIAKCMSDEVFNEHIGQAISLARALKIDVPVEFLQAVQPSEVVIGMVVDTYYRGSNEKNESCPTHVTRIYKGMPEFDNGTHSSCYKITDDTNAQYEVTPCQ